MSYLLLAIVGYILNATAILIDKVNVEKNFKSPFVYTFWIGFLGLSTLILIPFGFFIPDFPTLLSSLLSGGTFIIALLFFYYALTFDESSRVSPIVGSINAVFTLTLGSLLFSQILTFSQYLASILMILGLVTIALTHWTKHKKEARHLLFMMMAAFYFALSTLFLKEVFYLTTFINGLIWTKIFSTLTVLTFLLIPKLKSDIYEAKVVRHHFANKTTRLLALGQLSGATGGFLLSYAIFLSTPVIINSMQGIQYLFMLIVVTLGGYKFRHLLDEPLDKKVLLQKLFGSALITLGLLVLAFNS